MRNFLSCYVCKVSDSIYNIGTWFTLFWMFSKTKVNRKSKRCNHHIKMLEFQFLANHVLLNEISEYVELTSDSFFKTPSVKKYLPIENSNLLVFNYKSLKFDWTIKKKKIYNSSTGNKLTNIQSIGGTKNKSYSVKRFIWANSIHWVKWKEFWCRLPKNGFFLLQLLWLRFLFVFSVAFYHIAKETNKQK